jgi:ATP-dependent Lon protease
VAAAQEATRNDRPVGVVLQREAEIESPGDNDLHRVGTVATILRYVTGPDDTHYIICQGEQRFHIKEFIPGYSFLVARVEHITEPETFTTELEARLHYLKQQAKESLNLLPEAPAERASAVESVTAWKSSIYPAIPRMKRCRSPVAIWSIGSWRPMV